MGRCTSYSIVGVSAGDAGVYRCEVDNGCGAQASNPAVLSVPTPTSIVNFSIPGQPSSQPGDMVSIPVTIGNVGANQIQSLAFELSYDPTMLTFAFVETAGTLTDGWDLSTNLIGADLSVVGLNATSLAGDGVLLYLSFQVTGGASEGNCSALDFHYVQLNEAGICANTTDGQFCVCLKGDVTANGEITSFDAVQIIKHLASIPTPYDPLSTCNADTTCNGSISAWDAAQILKYSAGLISEFCTPSGPFLVNPTVDVVLADQTILPGESFSLPLELDGSGFGFEAFSFSLSYDPELVAFTDVVIDGGLLEGQDWVLVFNLDTPGTVMVSGAGFDEVAGIGTLLHLVGEHRSGWGVGEVRITSWQFNEGSPGVLIPQEPTILSVPGAVIRPAVIARGLGPISLQAEELCCDVEELEWTDLASGQVLGNQATLVLDPAPAETTVLQLTLSDRNAAAAIHTTAVVLVAENPAFFDLDTDGCNTISDLLLLSESWLWPVGPGEDANGDGDINILDLLYINTLGDCPEQ